jgi:hypothetical protein
VVATLAPLALRSSPSHPHVTPFFFVCILFCFPILHPSSALGDDLHYSYLHIYIFCVTVSVCVCACVYARTHADICRVFSAVFTHFFL